MLWTFCCRRNANSSAASLLFKLGTPPVKTRVKKWQPCLRAVNTYPRAVDTGSVYRAIHGWPIRHAHGPWTRASFWTPCPRAVGTRAVDTGGTHTRVHSPSTQVSKNDTRVHGSCWIHWWPTRPVNTAVNTRSVYQALQRSTEEIKASLLKLVGLNLLVMYKTLYTVSRSKSR